MPTIRLPPPLRVPPRIVRAAGNVPAAGVVPTSGTSPEAIPAGRIAFETHILIAHTAPTLDTAAFPSRFVTSLYEQSVTKASTVAGDVAIATAAPTQAESAAVRATLPTVLSISSDASSRWNNARWINIRGAFNATRPWTLSGLNLAIADALTNSIAWNETEARRRLSPLTIPEDGDFTQLVAALNASNACGGRRTYGNVIAAACTRWTALAATVTPQPTREGPVSVALPQCRTVTEDGFWLRPTPTFARTGPKFPANTPVELLERTEAVQGVYRLFRVAVANPNRSDPSPYLTGYAALRAADLARSTCAQSVPNGVLTNTYSRQSGGA